MPEYLTMKETQDLLKVSEDELFDLINDHKIRNYRIDRETRFKEAEVLAYKKGLVAGPAIEATTETLLDVDDLIDPAAAKHAAPAEVVTETLTTSDSQVFEQAAIAAAGARAGVATEAITATPMMTGKTPVFSDQTPMFGDQTLDLIDETPTIDEGAAAKAAPAPAVAKAEKKAEKTESKTARSAPTGKVGSVSGGTEEIHFADDEFKLDEEGKTQEITVVEAPVGAAPAARAPGGATVETINVEAADDLAPGESPKDRKAAERAAAAAERSAHAESMQRQHGRRRSAARMGDELGLLWAALLIVPAAVALVLVALMVNLAFGGFTTQRDTVTRSSLHLDKGRLPEVGNLQPTWQEDGWFGSMSGLGEMWGYPELRKTTEPAAAPAAAAPEAASPAAGEAPAATPAP